ncbi:zinc ABC transporter substrate-binding protein ZnuA [Vibrio sp. SCSIO 43137]|uniref:zinc ABC transporter substrate-binding protein ZnuA n=1 Tax=Vibrio sp. SCSIO 43137 TaxID=3021011 RepID=UPI002307BEBA|nr:zinc ABC transporter substrate-binding protein ZnuA [Vibrio sp. SCSIO 43137]WCE28769.1 zinc ABC transporter substrate-binding protein ZnuA [Vibrio sp. SCSIO 43137]
MKRIVCGLLSLLLSSHAAHAIDIVTSIKPLQLITLEITQGVTKPELLVNSTASPHDYALKPSDVRKVVDADLVIWLGPELESFLPKVMAKQKSQLQLSASDKITFREFGEEAGSHEGHNHGAESIDPHIWLGPLQAGQSAKVITDKLAEVDPQHAEIYQNNYKAFIKGLDKTVADLTAELAPLKSEGYYVFHDGYGYFEDQFRMNKQGYFTLSPERKPGAKTIIQIKSELRSGKASCVFTEPQFKPSIVKSVTRGTQVTIGELDPLATKIAVKPSAYFEFLADMGNRFSQCLNGKS